MGAVDPWPMLRRKPEPEITGKFLRVGHAKRDQASDGTQARIHESQPLATTPQAVPAPSPASSPSMLPSPSWPRGPLSASRLASAHATLACHPEYNHMARVAGLLLQLGLTPPSHAPPRLLYDGLGAAVLQHGTQHATLSLIYLEAPRAGPGVAASALAASLADSGCWREEWSADPPLGAPSSRVTLPAMPDPLVEAAGGALQLLGRRVTFDEPCRTWEAPRESWRPLHVRRAAVGRARRRSRWI